MKYELNTAYPLPVPTEIGTDDIWLLHQDGTWKAYWIGRIQWSTHWCKRSPLPVVPKPKTQAELDEEALAQFEPGMKCLECRRTWFAALAYARKETK